jgi:hypothetical protein
LGVDAQGVAFTMRAQGVPVAAVDEVKTETSGRNAANADSGRAAALIPVRAARAVFVVWTELLAAELSRIITANGIGERESTD